MTARGKAGTAITILSTYYENGSVADPFNVANVDIYDAATGGSTVDTGLVPSNPAVGSYSVTWTPNAALAAGTYYSQWKATANSGESEDTSPRSPVIVLGAGTPVRELILADIKSTLESISTANGYKTAVDTVEPFLRSRDEVKSGERPYIGFGPDSETAEHYSFGTIRVQLPFTVVGYIEEADWATASGKINDLRDDIVAAIMEDPTLGANCTQVILLNDLTSEADPDRRSIPGDGGAVVLNFRVTYYRDSASS
jgi:hypothetical protein